MTDSPRPFVHLHCHTHYSLLDGATKIPALISQVKHLGMNACAITDHGNLYGALEFYQKCREAHINPIIGYEAYVAPGSRFDRSATRMRDASFHLTLLAMNRQGFQNLVKMASSASLEGYHYRPRIDRDLLAAHSDGVLCLSGCASSELSRRLLGNELDRARQLVAWYVQVFGDRFYLEIQDAGVDIQQTCGEATIDLANSMGLPLVATNDAHYLCQTDASMHDVLLCVNTKAVVSDQNRMKMTTDQLFVRSPEQMYAAFPQSPDAVARSQEIADRCDIQLDLKTRHFPVFQPPAGKTDLEHLRELAHAGLLERYGASPPAAYVERLAFELDVIERMGFASYFLIVWDFARFARSQGIPCSARGSACGALVSYVLGLSDVCPMKYDLLFERFLDPNRAEAPDIDIDFCQDRRELVIQYVKEKYGYANVAQIGTFGTLKAKAAVRDVCRALGVDLKRADVLAKMVPEELNIKLKDALAKSPDLKAEYEKDPQVRQVIDYAQAIEGLAKSAGTHAAGVVIADRPLDEYVPLQKLPGKEDVLTQWTDVEKAGLLKMDFLGLRNLTILDRAVQLVRRRRSIELVPRDLPLDDGPTFALLQRGETKGVFQLESGGMRDLLTKMKPDRFEDIIATSALYRPGPLEGGMVMTYVNCKHGREPIPKVHPIVDDVLAETYGVMVYQEQVMRILNRLGGIELASAYKCIKAISKKKHDEITKYKADFLAGAVRNAMPEAQAEDLFELIAKFAGYGFNKSHSTAYGAIAYQTAYLKAHYPAEFMAALLSCGMESSERIAEHSEDARRMGLELLPPCVNRSEVEFTVVDAGSSSPRPAERPRTKRGRTAAGAGASHEPAAAAPPREQIAFGLGAIRGMSLACLQAIVAERGKSGPFRSVFDLCERVDPKILTKGNLEILIKAGALDVFVAQGTRAQHFAAVDRAIQAATARQRDRQRGQRSLFGGDQPAAPGGASSPPEAGETALPSAEPWTHSQQLAFEREVLGFYLTSHPLSEHSEALTQYTTHKISQLRDLGDGKEVLLGGVISAIKLATTKQPSRNGNSRYANFDLEDPTGVVRCILWPDDYARQAELVKTDAVVIVKGRTDARGREPNVIVNKLFSLQDAEKEFARQVMLRLRRGYHGEHELRRARDVLSRRPGKTPVVLCVDTWEDRQATAGSREPDAATPGDAYARPGAAAIRCFVNIPMTVTCSAELRKELSDCLGDEALRVLAGSPGETST